MIDLPLRHAVRCAALAHVVRATRICREHIEVELALADFPPSHPGQFLQLLCREGQSSADAIRDWPADGFPSLEHDDMSSRQPYLRRPFSIADRFTHEDGSTRLCVISRTVGPGTAWLERLRVGDDVDLTGPLGRGFRLPAKHQPAILVGGGVGIPPLLYLARCLHEAGHEDVLVILGATTRELLAVHLSEEPASGATATPCVALPGAAPFGTLVTSDDGSIGMRGVVTEALAQWFHRDRDRAAEAQVYACGPDPMLQAVARLTRELKLACQLCIERNMGCGVGTCLSCVVRALDKTQAPGWRWALTCTDGPVFDRDQLIDYQPPQQP